MANFIISELAKKDITDIWNSKVARRRPQYRRTLEREVLVLPSPSSWSRNHVDTLKSCISSVWFL